MKTNWQTKKLGEVCLVISGQSPDSHFYNNKGEGLPFYQGKKEFQEKFIGKPSMWTKRVTKEAKEYDILMSVRAPVGPINFATCAICIGRGLAAIRAKEEVDKNFLFYYLLSKKEAISGKNGAVFPSISKTEIENIFITFPSINQQKRIVIKLDEVFEKIEKAKENTEKNLRNSRELFESYARIAFKNPGNWINKTLGEVCNLYQGLAINAKTKHVLVEKSDLPLLRIKDLKNNTVEQYIDPNNFPKNALINESDLIYTRTGQIGLVFTGRKGVLHNNSFKIVPSNILTKEFLYYWLQNPNFKSKVIKLASRAAQPDITHVLFKQQLISVPPLLKQKEIVKKLDEISEKTKKLEEIYRKKLTDLEELKKSILNEAFSGRL